MLFDDWITAEELSYRAVAERIGAANASVARRYAKGVNIPSRAAMKRIYIATRGRVTPNDFYELPKLRTVAP